MDSGLFSSGDRGPPPALRAGESSQTRSGVGGVPGRLGAVSAHRVAQHIAAAPDGLDVVVAAGRVGQLLAKLADEDVYDLQLRLVHAAVEMIEAHLPRSDKRRVGYRCVSTGRF